jgi:hypothetical protein
MEQCERNRANTTETLSSSADQENSPRPGYNEKSKAKTNPPYLLSRLLGLGAPAPQPGWQPFLRFSVLLTRPSPPRGWAPRSRLAHRKKNSYTEPDYPKSRSLELAL